MSTFYRFTTYKNYNFTEIRDVELKKSYVENLKNIKPIIRFNFYNRTGINDCTSTNILKYSTCIYINLNMMYKLQPNLATSLILLKSILTGVCRKQYNFKLYSYNIPIIKLVHVYTLMQICYFKLF